MSEAVTIKVPDELRPTMGPLTQRFDALCARGQAAMRLVTTQSAPMLRELCRELVNFAQTAACPLDAASKRRVMALANDIRGMASPIGSDLSADIADSIYDFCDRSAAAKALPQALILLLAESCRRLIGYRRDADGGALQIEVRTLLGDVEAKLDELGALLPHEGEDSPKK